MTEAGGLLERVVGFHGHLCPGLTMGMQAARIALREIGPHAVDEEIVAIVETDMCGVDAIQVMTGCTFGKGNLIHRDWGKNAYTFFRRSDGKAIRIAARPDAWDRGDDETDHGELRARARADDATEEDRRRFREAHEQRARRILERDPEDIYVVTEIASLPPRRARIHESVMCADCGENVMETRVRLFERRELCTPCFAVAIGEAPVPGGGLPVFGKS
jgi:formylmethanofuran dehydrogenase subunit E